jgi:radical SAM protein with 4Fe4S-binding SPASM domain
MRLDAAFLGRLLAAGVGYFELSLPAVDEEGFRRLTGLNGVRVVRDAMLELAAARVPFTVSTVLTRINRDGIGDVIELAAACGAAAVALNRFVPGGRGAAHADSLSLDDASLWAVLQAAGTAAARCAIPVACTIPIEPCLIPHDGLPHLEFTACACGERKWAIAPDGGLRTCEQNPQVLGNLLSESFATLIAKTAVQAFRRNERRGSTCRDCISRTVCGGGCRFIGRQEAPATVCAATSSE